MLVCWPSLLENLGGSVSFCALLCFEAIGLSVFMYSFLFSFINDTGYKELMQNSARFNVRIRKDRIYRQPYIDGQTGVYTQY